MKLPKHAQASCLSICPSMMLKSPPSNALRTDARTHLRRTTQLEHSSQVSNARRGVERNSPNRFRFGQRYALALVLSTAPTSSSKEAVR